MRLRKLVEASAGAGRGGIGLVGLDADAHVRAWREFRRDLELAFLFMRVFR